MLSIVSVSGAKVVWRLSFSTGLRTRVLTCVGCGGSSLAVSFIGGMGDSGGIRGAGSRM